MAGARAAQPGAERAGVGRSGAERAGTGEIKRMWVDPTSRGLRLGAALLDALETSAAGHGVTELRLETGAYLTSAVALYRSAGFADGPPWGRYVGMTHSLTMVKRIDHATRRRWRSAPEPAGEDSPHGP